MEKDGVINSDKVTFSYPSLHLLTATGCVEAPEICGQQKIVASHMKSQII